MKQKKLFRLQLFAEGAEGEGAAASDTGVTAEPQVEAPEQSIDERIGLLEQQMEQLRSSRQETRPDETLVRQHWQGVERIYQALANQAEELKQLYPGFDLQAEMRDRRFAGMLRWGVDMRSAYQALHGDEILPAAMQYAAKTVEQRLAGSMLSRAQRPGENGLHGGGAVAVGSNAGKMSRQDYDRICRMVERGERVSFG